MKNMDKKEWVFGALALAALTAAALAVAYDRGNTPTPVPAVVSVPSYADDFSQFVRGCGTPNHEDSTLPDDDRNRTAPDFIKPYFVTRDIDYDRAHLRIFLMLNKSANPAWPTCRIDEIDGASANSASCAPVPPYEWRVLGYFNLDHWHPMDAGMQDTTLADRADPKKLKALAKFGTVDRLMPPNEAAARLKQLCKTRFRSACTHVQRPHGD
jgi:hypothetical protein